MLLPVFLHCLGWLNFGSEQIMLWSKTFGHIKTRTRRGPRGSSIIYDVLSGFFHWPKNILQHWELKLSCLYSQSDYTICDVMPLWCTFGLSGYNDFQTEDQVINSRAKHSLRRCNHPVEARWMISLYQNTSLRRVTNPYRGRLAVTWYHSHESSYSQLHVLHWVMRSP